MSNQVRADFPGASAPDHRHRGEAGTEYLAQDDLRGIAGDPRHDFRYRVTVDDASLGRLSFRPHHRQLENWDAA